MCSSSLAEQMQALAELLLGRYCPQLVQGLSPVALCQARLGIGALGVLAWALPEQPLAPQVGQPDASKCEEGRL